MAGAVGFEPTITVLETVALGHWATLLQWADVHPYVWWAAVPADFRASALLRLETSAASPTASWRPFVLLVVRAGIEPATVRLSGERSTAELPD